MDLLWEKFQWILHLYMKPISCQSKASVVCSVATAILVDFCLKKLNVFCQHIGKKNKWISEFCRTVPQELKCWSTFCVNYFLRYYLMMQHRSTVELMEWLSTQALSDPISSLSLLLLQTQAARWKAATPEQLTGAHLYLDIAKSGCLFHAVGNVMG